METYNWDYVENVKKNCLKTNNANTSVQGRRTKSQAHARDAYKGAPKAQNAPAYKAQNEQSAHNSKQGGARYIRTNKGYKNTPWPLNSFNFKKLTLFENRLKNGTFLPSWRRKVHKRSPARKNSKKLNKTSAWFVLFFENRPT